MNNSSETLLLLLLLGAFSSANDVDLATNSTFLLLLGLILLGRNPNTCNSCNNNCGCNRCTNPFLNNF